MAPDGFRRRFGNTHNLHVFRDLLALHGTCDQSGCNLCDQIGPDGSKKRSKNNAPHHQLKMLLNVFWIPLTEAWCRGGAEPNERHAAWERDVCKNKRSTKHLFFCLQNQSNALNEAIWRSYGDNRTKRYESTSPSWHRAGIEEHVQNLDFLNFFVTLR